MVIKIMQYFNPSFVKTNAHKALYYDRIYLELEFEKLKAIKTPASFNVFF